MKYRWLHLSDLHSYCDPIKTKIMRDALIDEINELNKEQPFSFILITGDISDQNRGYDKARELIWEIMSITGLSSKCVFIVPGNHDLDRKKPKGRKQIVEKLWETNILNDIEEEAIQQLMFGQYDFYEAYESILQRRYPIDKVHFIMNFDNNINIIHLNTSWMCYDSIIETGKIHIGLNKVYSCLEMLNDEAINIAIGHHRISDFNKVVGNSLKSIFKSKKVDLYLGGHCHKAFTTYDINADTEFCFCKQTRAEDYNYPAGFVVGNIDIDNNQNYFVFYNWSVRDSIWKYDYSVESAKHGKYYLQGKKFNNCKVRSRDIIIDFKLLGMPLDFTSIKQKFKLKNTLDYRLGYRDIDPKDHEDWYRYLKDLLNFYNSIIEEAPDDIKIHIFPLAPIPLLVALGYLMQNNNSNINIYQYDENNGMWVFNEKDDKITIKDKFISRDSDKLVFSLNVSACIKTEDIDCVINDRYDLLSIGVENPTLSYLNYNADVLRVKKIVKEKLDSIAYKYNEIHLFLAAPAGLCIEIGRIIRKNIYPNTFIYNYCNADIPRYTKIYNLKEIKQI